MLKLQHVLFASDLSDSSKGAYPYACSLARDHAARLTVLHVVPHGTHAFLAAAQLGQGDSKRQFHADIMADLERHHPRVDGVPTEYVLDQGNAADTVVRAAKAAGCDLIVVGKHGRSGLSRLLMGTVAEHIMRSSSCPVLVVKDNWVHSQ